MTLPEEAENRKPKPRSEIASDEHRYGLSFDEFCTAAKGLIDAGLHPVAIGKSNPGKPDKPAGKAPWHTGVTGYNGVDPHIDRVMEWPQDVAQRITRGERGLLNLGMRMPVGGLGLDVDAYDDKRGATTIAEYRARFGCLPDTYRITARPYAEGSGIRLYRVPDDWRGKTILKTADGADGHVELIQRHHRLAAVPPSYHHTGSRYRVYDERTGSEVPNGAVPPLEDWSKLPDSWLEGLAGTPAKAVGEATDAEVERFSAEHVANQEPWHLTDFVVPTITRADGETRNAAFDALHEAARMARVGWYPWAVARGAIEVAAQESYAERGLSLDEADFSRSERYAIQAANSEDIDNLRERATKRLARRLAVKDWAPIHDQSAAKGEVASWAPVDIALARTTVGSTPPTILARSDGNCLFYRGKVHSVHGESESGKSWLAQCATAEVLLAGESVLYLDFEDDAGPVAERLIRLGVPIEVVDNSAVYAYVHPEAPPKADIEQAAFTALLSGVYSLAVIDGVTDSMGLFGLSGKDADDVAQWLRLLPKAIARETGAAVVLVDHVAKDTNTRGRFALGSQHKMAGLSGAAYLVEMEQPFAVGQAGAASVRVGKDRPGQVRGLGGRWRKSDRTQHVADLHLDSTDPDLTTWALTAPENAGLPNETDAGKAKSKSTFRPTWFMEQVSRYWEETEDAAERTNNKTINAMCAERKGQGKTQNRDLWRTATKLLTDEGYAKSIKGARDSDVFSIVKSYRQIEDPLCGAYSEAAAQGIEGWKYKLDSGAESDEFEAGS
ncbi:AAA family ATPase [Mycobacterium sp.]|uniref:AAA family ATPase n=1 Tax=Mycobacterium sp. TaxID=1785 RepID=UPI003D0EBB91